MNRLMELLRRAAARTLSWLFLTRNGWTFVVAIFLATMIMFKPELLIQWAAMGINLAAAKLAAFASRNQENLAKLFEILVLGLVIAAIIWNVFLRPVKALGKKVFGSGGSKK